MEVAQRVVPVEYTAIPLPVVLPPHLRSSPHRAVATQGLAATFLGTNTWEHRDTVRGEGALAVVARGVWFTSGSTIGFGGNAGAVPFVVGLQRCWHLRTLDVPAPPPELP